MDVRGQGALEYLLLIGGAVLVAAIVIALITGVPTATVPPECSSECASLTTPVLSTVPPSTDICTGHTPTSNPDCSSFCAWSGTTCYYNP